MTGQQTKISESIQTENDLISSETPHITKQHIQQADEPTLDSCCSIATPMHRRLQTMAVAWHCSSFVVFTLINLFLLSSPFCWLFMIPYLIYFFNDRSPANGNVVNRYSLWFRSLYIWDLYCEYFPVSLIKSADLKPTFSWEPQQLINDDNENTSKIDKASNNGWKIRIWPSTYRINIKKRLQNNDSQTPKGEIKATGPRYIFGYHPHGIGALGAFGAFGTEGCHWSKKFPGIPISLMTLVTQFHIPLYRDYLLALGITSVSRKNALKVLQNNQSICIVVGGARESLLTEPNKVELILNKRKGFIKLALETGNVGVVPTFVFGENNTYQIFRSRENSWLRNIQLWIKANFGFTIPIFYARGLFNYDFGLLPFRTPLTVITGKPIYIKEKINNPSEDIVNHYHELYIEELKNIYCDYRDQYDMSDVDFNIVG
ncbi:similar to Saccharomyces cerevisiae YOR245C DGA1 Diacylglycerol acyltransferase [Maudiozyma barnettii]|uniref:Diacylglycerol O-acyltransferase n=1 Tax=Maudiozyma barnettii TaxID=61262 RepID=A0A8H2VDE8_9SACH|nr:diacylglycerol O-acyltransferase [Kazachstania barnettii]CAB4253243.1 similar to Saccharomyces cerevisiae YOR245C DGA1 Diacylglycerol acyltransferase [Kazachstania barnettii]CAD1780221.1 similar to Saccharomyces cerevisiae YOR245C DGA1 Diacylglycerol acyltransferase [Kazachstania barnettii]